MDYFLLSIFGSRSVRLRRTTQRMHKDHKEETSASLEENCNGLVFEREKATMKLPSAILWMPRFIRVAQNPGSAFFLCALCGSLCVSALGGPL